MRVGTIRRAPKSGIKIGQWGSGHLQPRYFSLRAKASSFKFGPQWDWAVIEFDALGHAFRVLVLLNQPKNMYRAILAMNFGGGEYRQICVHEFHASEPGWHCHVVLHTDNAPTGWGRRGMRRTPRGVRIQDQFGVTKANAIRIAQKVFKIEVHGPLI